MELQPGEAAILIIRRNDEREPKKYFFAVRTSESSFDQQTKDFQMSGFQHTELELGENLDFEVALEKAIAAIQKLKRSHESSSVFFSAKDRICNDEHDALARGKAGLPI